MVRETWDVEEFVCQRAQVLLLEAGVTLTSMTLMAILSAGSSKATTGGVEHKMFLYFWAGGREGEK